MLHLIKKTFVRLEVTFRFTFFKFEYFKLINLNNPVLSDVREFKHPYY